MLASTFYCYKSLFPFLCFPVLFEDRNLQIWSHMQVSSS